jgi:DHA1 family bicyclomycin/chloramphenicol resistance-like MFS transporter
LVFTLASIGAALAPSFSWLLAFRALQGLSAGGGRVVGQAIVRDRFEGAAAQRLMSQIVMVFGLAPAIAPVIGGYLHAAFGWRSVFVFMVAIGLLLLIASHRFLEESLEPQSRIRFHPITLVENYCIALQSPRFVARSLSIGFAFGGLGLYISAAAGFVIGILKLPETAFAWLFVPMVGGMVIGSAISARLAKRMNPATTLRLGFACMAAAALANLAYNALFAAAVPWAVLPIMFYTLGLGLSSPGMTLMTLDLFPRMRGLAASLMSFVQTLIFSLISGIIAPLLFGSAFKLAFGVFVLFVLGAICWGIGTRNSDRI